MFQMLSQLGMVFTVTYPPLFKDCLRWMGVINLDVVNMAPFECTLPYSFYSSLVSHTVIPMVAVVALLCGRAVFKAAGRPAIASRCVTAAFYVVFFVLQRLQSSISR